MYAGTLLFLGNEESFANPSNVPYVRLQINTVSNTALNKNIRFLIVWRKFINLKKLRLIDMIANDKRNFSKGAVFYRKLYILC